MVRYTTSAGQTDTPQRTAPCGQKGSKKMNANETMKTISKTEQKRLAGNAAIRYRNACIDYFFALLRAKPETDMATIMANLSETYFTMLDMNEIRYHIPEENCAHVLRENQSNEGNRRDSY